MITIFKKLNVTTKDNNNEIELRGLSTDEKPDNVANGTVFIEIDTGKIFMYDLENEQWKEM